MEVTHNLISQFVDVANKFPMNIAIICGGKSIKYDELLDSVKQKAWHLKAKGVNVGDRVLLVMPMSINFYINLLAVFYIDAVAVVVDSFKDSKVTNNYLKKANCDAAIFSRKGWGLLLFYKQLCKIGILLGSKQKLNTSLNTFAKVNLNSPALITYTTGSTGNPKAALRSHDFLLKQNDVLSTIIKPNRKDIDFVTLPIVLLMNLGVGATSLILEKQIVNIKTNDLKRIISVIQKMRITRITSSPFFLTSLAKIIKRDDCELNVKRVYTGGGPVFPTDAKEIIDAINPTEFKVIYGSTEAEPISVIDGFSLKEEEVTKGLSVGSIYGDIKLKIIKIERHPLSSYKELSFGNIGEIIVSGEHTLKTYYNSPEAFLENKIVEDNTIWHRTGDAGYIDKNNLLYLTGRVGQMIFLGNRIISPFLIENSLSNIEGVSKGTIILNKNNEIEIIVESTDTSLLDIIVSYLKKADLPFKNIRFVKTIPIDTRHRTKIDYSKLVE